MAATSRTETWDAFFNDFYLRAYADDARDAEAEERRWRPPGSRAARRRRAARRAVRVRPPRDRARPRRLPRHRRRPLAALLAEARRRAGGERWPKFVHADYRELPFKDESFDAALNLYTSLGYLGDEEDTRVLAEIRRVLREGGRLVIETNAPRPADPEWPTATGG